jgi:hypothetical protein
MAKVADNINATAQAHIFYWSTFSTPVSTSGTRGYEFDVKRDPSADGLNNLETVLSLGPGTSTTNGATDYLDVFFDLGNCRPINNAANQPVTDTIMKASYIGPTNIAPSFISATGSTIAGGGAGGTLTLTLPTGTGVTTPGQISFTIPALSSTIGAAGLIPVPGSYNPATFAIPAGANQTTGGGYTFTPSGQSCSGTCTGSVTTVTVYMGFSGGQLSNVRQDGRMLKDGWCREHVYFNSAVNNGVQNGTPAVLQWYTTDGVSRSHSGRGTGYLIRNLTGD